MKIDSKWGGGRDSAYKDAPQHRNATSRVPAGGNQVFIDGSARFIKFEKMYYLTLGIPMATAKMLFLPGRDRFRRKFALQTRDHAQGNPVVP